MTLYDVNRIHHLYIPRRIIIAIFVFGGSMMLTGFTTFTSVVFTGPHGMAAELGWDNTHKGYLFSSFYWGLLVSNIIYGILSQHHGPKTLYGIGVLMTALLNFGIPLVTQYQWIVLSRIGMGLFCGIHSPGNSMVVSRWFPAEERSRAAAFIFGSGPIAIAITFVLAPYLMNEYGWRRVFYLYSEAGLMWASLWFLFGSDSPEEHPTITLAEKLHISKNQLQQELPGLENNPKTPPPALKLWGTMFSTLPFWGVLIALVAHNWSFFTLGMYIPQYFNSILGFKMTTGGIYQIFPYLLNFIMGQVGGRIIEILTGKDREKAILDLTNSRKLLCLIGYFTPAILLSGVSFVNPTLAVIFLILAVGISGFVVCTTLVNLNDIAPHHSGIAMGAINALCKLSAIISPIVCGNLLDWGNCVPDTHLEDTLIQPPSCLLAWKIIFWVTSSLYLIGCLAFLLLGTATQVIDENGMPIIGKSNSRVGGDFISAITSLAFGSRTAVSIP